MTAKQASLKNTLLYGILSGGGGFFVKVAIMVLLTPVIIHHLGVEAYGAYLLFLNLSEMAKLIASGMTKGFVNRYSEALVDTDSSKKRSLLQVGLLVYSALSLSMMLLGWLLLPLWVTALFNGATVLSSKALLDIGHIVLLTTGLTILSEYLLSILFAHCLQAITHWVDTFQTILCGIVSVIALISQNGLEGVFTGRMAVIAGVFLLLLGLVQRYEKQFTKHLLSTPHPTGQKTDSSLFKSFQSLLSISIFSVIQRISVFIAHRLDEVVVATFLTLTQVSVLGVIVRLFSQLSSLMVKLLDGIFPLFSRFHADTSQQAKARYLFLRSMSFIHYTTCLFLIAVVASFPEVLHFLSDGKVTLAQSLVTMLLMCALTWTGSIQIPASNYLFSSGMHRFQTISTVVTASVNLLCSIVFVQWIGLPGVVLGSVLPHSIQNHAVTINLAIKRLKISWLQLLKEVYMQSLPALLVAAIPLGIMRLSYGSTLIPLWLLILITATTITASIATWLVFSLDKTEQTLLLDQLFALAKRIPAIRKKLGNNTNTSKFMHPTGASNFPVQSAFSTTQHVCFTGLLSHNPLVSVVVPCYNAAPFLEELVDSIKQQTYPHWELILINDHSTDETGTLINTYSSQDARIQSIQLKHRKGKASSVRNAGIQRAKGEFITFMDADDACFQTALEQLLSPFNSHGKHLNATVAFPYYADIQMKPLSASRELVETSAGHFAFKPGLQFDWESICKCSYTFSLASSMFRRTVFDTFGLLDEHQLSGEDFKYIVGLLDTNWNSVRFIPTATFLYRQYTGSVTKNPDRVQETVECHEKLADWLFSRPSVPQSAQQSKGFYLAKRYRSIVGGLVFSGRRDLGRQIIWKAFKHPDINMQLFLKFFLKDTFRAYCPEVLFQYYLNKTSRAQLFQTLPSQPSFNTNQSTKDLIATAVS